MTRSRSMRDFVGGGPPRKDQRRQALRKRKSVRLTLKTLETRLTPTATNPTLMQAAGGYTALTAAIAGDTAANTNYVIQIANSFMFHSGGQVSISKLGAGSTLTIEGQSGTHYTLTGDGNRLFTVASGQNVTFKDLTLTGGGSVSYGGALLDQGGNVTLSRVFVQANTTRGVKAAGGGIYATGASTVVLRDSVLSNNTAQGSQGTGGTGLHIGGIDGGSAFGGGLYVSGSGWNVTLIGVTLSGNTAIGGNGGNGAAGANATAPNTSGGNGGIGGKGGDAEGGAAYFFVSSGGSGQLTILNDLGAPIADPSILIDNTVLAGAGGNGGNGGTSTGTANDSYGGGGGTGGQAEGGALFIGDATGATVNVNIGNSAFYSNKAAAGSVGADGAFGTGGVFYPPPQPALGPGPLGGPAPLPGPYGALAAGGGIALESGNVTIVNCTIAKNTVLGGYDFSAGASDQGPGYGGGIYDDDAASVVLDNNTITQNSVSGGNFYSPQFPLITDGGGLYVASGNPTLLNNLIQGNQSPGSPVADLHSAVNPLSNASNNFIGSDTNNAVDPTTNIVGNPQLQLGSAVGVDANGNSTGGPIYYLLLPGVVSLHAGTVNALGTIAAVEGTSVAKAVDQIGNLRSINGSIDLGSIQSGSKPPSPPPAPSGSNQPPTPAPPVPVVNNVPPLLSFFNSLLGGVVAVNANGTETITDSVFGIPLLVSTFNQAGYLVSVDLFGIFNVTFLFL